MDVGLFFDIGSYLTGYAYGREDTTPESGIFVLRDEGDPIELGMGRLLLFADAKLREIKPTHMGWEEPFSAEAGKKTKAVDGARPCPTCGHIKTEEIRWTNPAAQVLVELSGVLRSLAGAHNVIPVTYGRSSILKLFTGNGRYEGWHNGKRHIDSKEAGKIACEDRAHGMRLISRDTPKRRYDQTDAIAGWWTMSACRGLSIKQSKQRYEARFHV